MNWDEVEKRLQNYKDQPYPVDTDLLWANVQPHIPTERKDDRKALLFIFAALCMVCSSWMYINNAYHIDPTPVSQIDIIEYAADKTKATQESVDNESTDLTPTVEDNGLSKSIVSPLITSTNTKKARILDNSKVYTKHPSFHQQVINPVHANIAEDYSEAERHDVSYDHSSVNSKPYSATSREIHALSSLYSRAVSPLTVSIIDIDPIRPQYSSMNPIVVIKSSPAIKWYSEVQLSASYGHGRVTPSNMTDFKTGGRSAEQSLPSYGAQITAGVQVGNHWSVQMGLRYAQLFKYSTGTINIENNVEIDNAVITEKVTANGVIPVYGTITATEKYDRTAKRVLSYTIVELPATLLYSHNDKKWGWDIGLGAATSLWQKKSGYIHIDNKSEYDIAQDNEELYRRDPLWSAHGTLGIRHHLRHNIDMYARGRYTYYLNSYSASNSPYQETLNGAHLDIGMRFHF